MLVQRDSQGDLVLQRMWTTHSKVMKTQVIIFCVAFKQGKFTWRDFIGNYVSALWRRLNAKRRKHIWAIHFFLHDFPFPLSIFYCSLDMPSTGCNWNCNSYSTHSDLSQNLIQTGRQHKLPPFKKHFWVVYFCQSNPITHHNHLQRVSSVSPCRIFCKMPHIMTSSSWGHAANENPPGGESITGHHNNAGQ